MPKAFTTPPHSFRSHFLEIMDRFLASSFALQMDPNGTKSYSFFIDNQVYPHRHRNSSSIYIADLQKISHYLESIFNRSSPTPTQNYITCLTRLHSLQQSWSRLQANPLFNASSPYLPPVPRTIQKCPSFGSQDTWVRVIVSAGTRWLN